MVYQSEKTNAFETSHPYLSDDSVGDRCLLEPNLELHNDIQSTLELTYIYCKLWQQKPVPAVQKQPVVSAIPTLILAGEYDPATPPANGELAARTLSRSYFFQFPGTGHGVISTNKCPDSITHAFLDNPAMKPDAHCIASMQEPDFF